MIRQRALSPYSAIFTGRILVAVIVVTHALLSTDAHAAEILEIDSQIVRELTIESVQQAIVKASAMRGWQITEKAPGHLQGVIRIKSQIAVIDILFDRNHYRIRHNRSENMKHKKNKIHKNFNIWVKVIDGDIRAMLSYM